MANTNSNSYTLIYATILTLIVAVALAATATGLKPIQDVERALDKKQQILGAVVSIADKAQVNDEFDKRIKKFVVDEKRNMIEGVDAFDIDLKKQYRKDPSERQLPIYKYSFDDGKSNFIIPLHGAGLWDEIWGYVAMADDLNTITGTSFDHKGETPGLGAEISKDWFENQFKGKKLLDSSGDFQLEVLKGKGNPQVATNPAVVDGISGATITGDGVEDMIAKGMDSYKSYLNTLDSKATVQPQP